MEKALVSSDIELTISVQSTVFLTHRHTHTHTARSSVILWHWRKKRTNQNTTQQHIHTKHLSQKWALEAEHVYFGDLFISWEASNVSKLPSERRAPAAAFVFTISKTPAAPTNPSSLQTASGPLTELFHRKETMYPSPQRWIQEPQNESISLPSPLFCRGIISIS